MNSAAGTDDKISHVGGSLMTPDLALVGDRDEEVDFKGCISQQPLTPFGQSQRGDSQQLDLPQSHAIVATHLHEWVLPSGRNTAVAANSFLAVDWYVVGCMPKSRDREVIFSTLQLAVPVITWAEGQLSFLMMLAHPFDPHYLEHLWLRVSQETTARDYARSFTFPEQHWNTSDYVTV